MAGAGFGGVRSGVLLVAIFGFSGVPELVGAVSGAGLLTSGCSAFGARTASKQTRWLRYHRRRAGVAQG